jgi:hypothetical protein
MSAKQKIRARSGHSAVTTAAARGELPAEEVSVALKLELAIEGIQCRS